jgi:hypothetical protein
MTLLTASVKRMINVPDNSSQAPSHSKRQPLPKQALLVYATRTVSKDFPLEIQRYTFGMVNYANYKSFARRIQAITTTATGEPHPPQINALAGGTAIVEERINRLRISVYVNATVDLCGQVSRFNSISAFEQSLLLSHS